MSNNCPQDGGFIGKSGCKHPNHEHSSLVKDIMSSRSLRQITPSECDSALEEGFYVNVAGGERVGFGRQLAEHIAHHGAADQRRRKTKLMYAVKTVKAGRKQRNPQGGPNSYRYAMAFDGFGILVLTDDHGDVQDVFDIIPNNKGGKMRLMRGQPHERSPLVRVLSDNLGP